MKRICFLPAAVFLVPASGAVPCSWGTGGFRRLGSGSSVTREAPVTVDVSGVLAGKDTRFFGWRTTDAGDIGNSPGANGEFFPTPIRPGGTPLTDGRVKAAAANSARWEDRGLPEWTARPLPSPAGSIM